MIAMKNKSFSAFEFKTGLLFDYTDNKFPTKLYSFRDGDEFRVDSEDSSFFIFQYSGYSGIYLTDRLYRLPSECYTVVNEGLIQFYGNAIVIERIGYNAPFMLGGPVEEKGRLKYIDGCTDSLLIPPVKLGDPCLNALFFPPGINQTQHTHPSMRVGLILKGKGECITPEGNIPLIPGMIFIIHEEGLHSFRTPEDSEMVVIAYHPDSDYGPSDEDHPMINRTIVDGVSANQIESIKTK